MAVVSTQKKDSKYAHLKKLYTKEKYSEATSEGDGPEIDQEKLLKIDSTGLITRQDILKNIILLLILCLLGFSGYLVSRFV